jgi:hypothetical protein
MWIRIERQKNVLTSKKCRRQNEKNKKINWLIHYGKSSWSRSSLRFSLSTRNHILSDEGDTENLPWLLPPIQAKKIRVPSLCLATQMTTMSHRLLGTHYSQRDCPFRTRDSKQSKCEIERERERERGNDDSFPPQGLLEYSSLGRRNNYYTVTFQTILMLSQNSRVTFRAQYNESSLKNTVILL